MRIFASEKDLIETIDRHDELVRDCVNGKINFDEFVKQYNDFYFHYALDGHESDENERALLEKYKQRIAPHIIIAHDILGKVCSHEDAEREIYQKAGRFGSGEAINRLKQVKFNA